MMLRANSSSMCLIQEHDKQSYIPRLFDHKVNFSSGGTYAKVYARLEAIIKPIIENETDMECTILFNGMGKLGKRTIVESLIANFGLHLYKVNCAYQITGDTSQAVDARIKHVLNNAASPCCLLLDNFHCFGGDMAGKDYDTRSLRSFRRYVANKSLGVWPSVVIAMTDDGDSLISEAYSSFLHHVELPALNIVDREDILRSLLDSTSASDLVPTFATSTTGLLHEDIEELVHMASINSRIRLVERYQSMGQMNFEQELDLVNSGITLQLVDFNDALLAMHDSQQSHLGLPKIPTVNWSDVGGLADVKQEILDSFELPLKHPELFINGMKRSGLLFYGPPGCGKTLLAKAVATECSLTFISVKGPELTNKYVGQSEANIRQVFAKARSAAPCVIFFDELDALAPNRGQSGDSGGVMDRVVSQLLAELDNLNNDVYVIGATNRPDLLDSSLLRPGRFDKMIYLGITENKEDQIRIIEALTRKYSLASDVDFPRVIDLCPGRGVTGADLYSMCADAYSAAIKRSMQSYNKDDITELIIGQNDFEEAAKSLRPSVSRDELEEYQQMHRSLQNMNSNIHQL